MILSFKQQFVAPINNGTKIHTIREDITNRWFVGRRIHMATGVRTPNYRCFNENHTCKGVQYLAMLYYDNDLRIYVNDVALSLYEMEELAVNDGFRSRDDFIEYFFGNGAVEFAGKIIHWTNFKY